jgi:hypothetical protein
MYLYCSDTREILNDSFEDLRSYTCFLKIRIAIPDAFVESRAIVDTELAKGLVRSRS